MIIHNLLIITPTQSVGGKGTPSFDFHGLSPRRFGCGAGLVLYPVFDNNF